MEVFWSKFAENRLNEIYIFVALEYNIDKASEIIQELVISSISLSKNPKIGQVETLIEKRQYPIRYLVIKKHKLLYRINTEINRIEILHVFDTRQDPNRISKET